MPTLPAPRGPLSEALLAALGGDTELALPADPMPADPLGDDDFQLALYVSYELAYQGFAEVDEDWEWSPALIGFRGALEAAMRAALFAELGEPVPFAGSVGDQIFALSEADVGPPLARFLETQATLDQFREFVIHRSAYQLKEADPHTWAIPRLSGSPKSAMVEIQADEYGGGDPERMHSRLFAKAMDGLGLDSRYGAYLDLLPGPTLATVNLISLFGFHRRWRGALVGHLACFEITSPQPNRRYGNGLRRLGLGAEVQDFYDEHVEADSVHENIAAYDLADGLAKQQPVLAGDIVFGARALDHLEARFAERLLEPWQRRRSSLQAGENELAGLAGSAL